MKKYLGFVAVSLFLLSCTNTDRDNPYDMWGSNYMGNAFVEGSSSSVETGDGPSSSSVAPSSSSVEPSSSSVLPSSSSEAESSSGIAQSSSSSAPPSSSSIAQSSSSSAPLSSSSIAPSSSSSAPPSSSSIALSSSSSAPPSSSSVSAPFTYGSLSYEGQSYKTIKIGTQTWMAENLNYNPGTGNSACYSNCTDYGRLYDWSTAMGFASSCNSTSCSNQIKSPHRGICPEGWHIPSSEDWGKLSRYVDGTSGTNAGYESTTAGKYLKAKSGWNSNGNGTDDYGFSALPGGYGLSFGSFGNVGYYGSWWSTSEYGSDNAYGRSMGYDGDGAIWDDYFKSTLYSVRCLQD